LSSLTIAALRLDRLDKAHDRPIVKRRLVS
jgi:hypothetical protein